MAQKVDAWSGSFNTLTAAVNFIPTTGSIYSGVIKEYHNVHGFILLKKPSTIRMIGQAPIVGTDIFDMVSNGEEFRLSIPPKNKFIVGKTSYHGNGSNSLENLRPRHILDALIIPPIDRSKERFFSEEAQTETNRYYILSVVQPGANGELQLDRKIWFDRSDLSITRLELYGAGGSLMEDIHYAGYEDFQGVHYPQRITLNRPQEGYTLEIDVNKATFNQPIPPDKFKLEKPSNATLVTLGEAK